MKFNKNIKPSTKEPKEEVKSGVEKMINEQITKEMYSVSVYEQLSSWADKNNFIFMAKWLLNKAAEELTHKHKFINYMYDRGWCVTIEAVDKPEIPEFEDADSLLKHALEHEKSVTASISDIQYEAEKTKDRLTYNFLDWFLREQIEEEAVLMDKISNWELSSDKLVFDKTFN